MKKYGLIMLSVALFSLTGCNIPGQTNDKKGNEATKQALKTQTTGAVSKVEKSNNNISNEKLKGNGDKFIGQNLQTNKTKMTDNKIVKIGDTVKVDYVGTFTDGKVFDTSIESVAKESGKYNQARTYEPLGFKVGAGQMIKCFDKGVVGMKVGETKNITCQPEEAYGKCDPKKVQKVEKSKLKDFEEHGYKLEKGTELPTQYGMLKIVDTDKDTVTLDMNNPMCGKVLNFKITVKSIQE